MILVTEKATGEVYPFTTLTKAVEQIEFDKSTSWIYKQCHFTNRAPIDTGKFIIKFKELNDYARANENDILKNPF